MRTVIKFVGPQGSQIPGPQITTEDVIEKYSVTTGKCLRVKPSESIENLTCRVEAIMMNRKHDDGRLANVLVVRPLSTLT